MVHPFDADRLRGARLPVGLPAEGYDRIAATLERKRAREARWMEMMLGTPPRTASAAAPPPATPGAQAAALPAMRRFANVQAVTAAGFTRVAAGTYRQAHHIWELRRAEDGSDDVCLVRKHEERAPDMREAAAVAAAPRTASGGVRTASRTAAAAAGATRGAPLAGPLAGLIGTRVLAVHGGELAEGEVLEVLPMGDLSVDFGEGAEDTPLDMVVDPDCSCVCHDEHGPMDGDGLGDVGGDHEHGHVLELATDEDDHDHDDH